jgi:hypothetical protein
MTDLNITPDTGTQDVWPGSSSAAAVTGTATSYGADEFLARLDAGETEATEAVQVTDLDSTVATTTEDADAKAESAPAKPRRTRTVREASATTYKPCACSRFEVVLEEPLTTQVDLVTGCKVNVTSKGTFAPGHDAKLKSMLIAAGRLGAEVVENDGAVTVHRGPVDTAALFSDKLAAQVQAGIDKPARAKREPKGSADESTMVEKKAADRHGVVKVGRWTYDAVIHADGTAEYTDRQGNLQSVAFGDYAEAVENDSPDTGDEF